LQGDAHMKVEGTLTPARGMSERVSRPMSRSTIAKAAASKDTPEKPYEIRAQTPQGLLLRVQPSGTRTFYVQVARGKRIRIGPAGTFTLKQAEERAKKIL